MERARHVLRRMAPVWLGSLDGGTLRGDLAAGLTVAVMLVPQGMAYALLGGIPPVYGLFASMVPLLVYAVFGGSKQLGAGIVAIDMLIVGGAIARIGPGTVTEAVGIAITLGMMAGALHLALGLLRLGFVTDFISRPVIVGFTTAAPILIGLSQLGNLMGVQLPRASDAIGLGVGIVDYIHMFDRPSAIVGLAAVVWLVLGRRFARRLPHPLLVVIAAGLAVWALELHSVHVLGTIAAGLPSPSLSTLRLEMLDDLFPSALALVAIQLMTVISLGKLIARRTRTVISPNRELTAIGLGNLLGGVFSAPPTSASFSRTAVNREAGARTPLSNAVAALAVMASVLFARPLLAHIPLPALAAIIIVAAVRMVDLAEMRAIFDLHRAEGGVALATSLVTLLLGVEAGVLTGIGASMCLMLYRTSRPRVAVLQRDPETGQFVDRAHNVGTTAVPQALVLRIDGALNFANAEHIRRSVLEHVDAHDDPIAVVLDGRGINFIDATAIGVLRDLLDALDARGVPMHLSRFKGAARRTVTRSGLRKRFAAPDIGRRTQEVVQRIAERAGDPER